MIGFSDYLRKYWKKFTVLTFILFVGFWWMAWYTKLSYISFIASVLTLIYLYLVHRDYQNFKNNQDALEQNSNFENKDKGYSSLSQHSDTPDDQEEPSNVSPGLTDVEVEDGKVS